MLSASPRFTPILLCAAILVTGCIDGPTNVGAGDSAESATGLTILLTDAPGDFLSAVVTISEIYFQGEGGRTVLMSEPYTTDLLTLRDSYATMVQGIDVPPGMYMQLRTVVSGAYIEVETPSGSKIFASSPDYPGLPAEAAVDGVLQMPSWGSSGLKIEMPDGHLEVGEGQTIVLIDFNVEESFGHEAGRSNRWVMRPHITATNVTFGGNVLAELQLAEGVTLPDLEGQPVTLGAFTAVLTPGAGGTAREIALTDEGGDGVFEALFRGLPPGEYSLDFNPPGLLLEYDPALPRSVMVFENQTTTETVTITSALVPASITATLALGDGVTLPSIEGSQVTLGQFRAQLTPTGGDPIEVLFTDPDENETFDAVFGDLEPGEYSLTVLPPAGVTATFDPVPPVVIMLSEGADEIRAFAVTAAGTT